MYSKNKPSIVNGLCAGVLVWIILLISDYIDAVSYTHLTLPTN